MISLFKNTIEFNLILASNYEIDSNTLNRPTFRFSEKLKLLYFWDQNVALQVE